MRAVIARLLLAATVGLSVIAAASTGEAQSAPTLLGLEHMPIAVRDLDAAQARFRALGFTLKPGRAHANGIRNAHAKFQDGSYLELITAPAAVDALTTEYRQHLAQGDGPAYLSLYVASMNGLAAKLQDLGARREDGTVTFAAGPLHAFFFGTRQRSPTDKPEHFEHLNGAVALDGVWFAPVEPPTVERLLTRLGARIDTAQACVPECGEARVAYLAEGRIIIARAGAQRVAGRALIGASIRVSHLDKVRAALRQGGIPMAANDVRDHGNRILVPPPLGNGLWLEFHE